jgi:hypothetical protein
MRRSLTSPPHVPIEGRVPAHRAARRQPLGPDDDASQDVAERAQSAISRWLSRVVQPLGSWNLEQPERGGGLILKLKTNDGYEVAFLLDEGMAGSLGHALLL